MTGKLTTWCLGLVSAILVLVADKGRPDHVWISLVPIALLSFLDAYYLGLERGFRNLYNGFVEKLHSGQAAVDDLFVVKGPGTRVVLLGAFRAARSIAVWPFYLLLALMMLLARAWVLGARCPHP